MEDAIADEAARLREEMNATALLVDRRASAKEEAKTLTKASVEEDRQGMATADPAFYLKDGGERK
jgi:hypothetical protein